MHHLKFRRSSIASSVLAFSVFALPATTFALEFAQPGTPGTLTFKVKVEGGAHHKEGVGPGYTGYVGYESIKWKIRNSGEMSILVNAFQPTADASAENRGKIGKVDSTYKKAVTDNDQAVIDKWQEKVDACGGNDACENRVQMQMFADPAYQRSLQKLQGAAPELMAAGRAVNTGARDQVWTNTDSASQTGSGKVQFDVEVQVFKLGNESGGPPIDLTCHWIGTRNIKLGSGGVGMGVFMTIDAKTSTYELQIPADQLLARLNPSCRDNVNGAHGPYKDSDELRVLGKGPGPRAKNFEQLLTFKGPVGSTRSPQFSGKRDLTTEWLGNKQPPQVPLKVTLEWQFSAKGR